MRVDSPSSSCTRPTAARHLSKLPPWPCSNVRCSIIQISRHPLRSSGLRRTFKAVKPMVEMGGGAAVPAGAPLVIWVWP